MENSHEGEAAVAMYCEDDNMIVVAAHHPIAHLEVHLSPEQTDALLSQLAGAMSKMREHNGN